MVICLQRVVDCLHNYGPADATAVPKKTHHLFSHLNPIWYRLTQVVPEKRPLNGYSFASRTIRLLQPVKPSFSANRSHCSLFFFFRTDYMIPETFTVTSEHIRFYFLVFFCFTL